METKDQTVVSLQRKIKEYLEKLGDSVFTDGSGTVLWSSGAMPANTTPFDLDLKSLPFNDGLTISITGAASNALIIYE